MRTFQTTAIASTLLAIVLFDGQEASAAKLCEIVACSNGCYSTVSKADDVPLEMTQTNESGGTCPAEDVNVATNGQYFGFTISLGVAPQPIAVDCAQSGHGVVCEGWPQGDSVTYSWSGSGSFAPDIGAGSANPVRGFSCEPGAQGPITVKAYSPSGASSTLTQSVTCPTTP